MSDAILCAEMERICEKHGGLLQADDVVSAAKSARSPLHSRFEWDDTKAGHEHRLWQARQLIRIVVQTIPSVAQPVNVFVSLDEDRHKLGGGYRRLVDVLGDDDKREQLLRQARGELRAFERKYRELQELAPLFAVLETVGV